MDKIFLINENKNKLYNLLKNTIKKLEYNNILIENLQIECNKFLNFINIIKIIKIYEWIEIKNNYIIIKKKINSDKKLYNTIIKIYGNITGYYSNNENNLINSKIKFLHSLLDLNISKFLYFKKYYKNLYNQYSKYKKNKNYIILIENNIIYNNILIKLDNIVNKTLILNREIYNLKKQKSKLIYMNCEYNISI
jgi:hypothetical protein